MKLVEKSLLFMTGTWQISAPGKCTKFPGKHKHLMFAETYTLLYGKISSTYLYICPQKNAVMSQ